MRILKNFSGSRALTRWIRGEYWRQQSMALDGCMLPFAQIAGRFHLIEAPTRTIYLPIGAGAPLCERLQKGEVSRTFLRKLGSSASRATSRSFARLDDAGALELLPDGSAILMDLSKYDEKTGLAMNLETGVGIFI